MVYVLDEGSIFDASLEKIWRFMQNRDGHRHNTMNVLSVEPSGENSVIITTEMKSGGKSVKSKMKVTRFDPVGSAMEFLEGPMKGSKSLLYYVPKGEKTGVTVVGEYKVEGLDDAAAKKTVLQFLEAVFNEDNESLRKMK